MSFHRARFVSGTFYLSNVHFAGAHVRFNLAEFEGASVHFQGAKFSAGDVAFDGAQFSGGTVTFEGARLTGCTVTFDGAVYSGRGRSSGDRSRHHGGTKQSHTVTTAGCACGVGGRLPPSAIGSADPL